jgi:hypothetical protein
MRRPWRLTIAIADALFRGARRPLPLRTWARNLNEAREATVLEMHVARCLAPFSIWPPPRAAPAAGAALVGLLRPQPHESWRNKLGRTAQQVADPSMRRSQHARAVAENLETAGQAAADAGDAGMRARAAGPAAAEAGEAGTQTRAPGLRRRRSLVWLGLSGVWGLAAVLVVTLDVQAAYRAPIVLSFLLICPGLTIVRALRITVTAAQFSLAIATSTALVVLVPAALLYAGAWSPQAALGLLIGVTLVVGAIDVLRRPGPSSSTT